jgi:hypothetical protein
MYRPQFARIPRMSVAAEIAFSVAALLLMSWWGGYALLGMLRAQEAAAQMERNTPARLRRRAPWASLVLWLAISVGIGFLLAGRSSGQTIAAPALSPVEAARDVATGGEP